MRKYGGVFGFEINQQLSFGEADKDFVRGMDAAIDKRTIPDESTLYRGLKTDPFVPNGIEPREGDVFAYNQYVSTSASKGQAEGFGKAAFLVVSAPAGAKALHLDKELGEPREQEWIFPRHTRLRIDRIEHSPAGKVYHVSVVGVADKVEFPKRMPRKKAEEMAQLARIINEPIPPDVLKDYPDLAERRP